MEIWIGILAVYGIINIFGFMGGCAWTYSELSENIWDILFFPKLWETARDWWDLNIAGSIIVCTLIGLFFLPAIVLTYAFYTILFFFALLCELFCFIFRRRD
jgi:hypothetical protein